MATRDSTDTGVGITRNSLTIPLEQRYNAWDNDFERLAPIGIDFLSNAYVDGFRMNAQPMGDSDIRNIAQGGSGADFKYGNEARIPKKNSNSIRGTYGAGPAEEIQKEFQPNAMPTTTRYTNKGLNYVDGIPGFNNEKYSPNGGPNLRVFL